MASASTIVHVAQMDRLVRRATLNKRGFAASISYRAGDCSIHPGILAREETRFCKLTNRLGAKAHDCERACFREVLSGILAA
jgi:hypothetical protein